MESENGQSLAPLVLGLFVSIAIVLIVATSCQPVTNEHPTPGRTLPPATGEHSEPVRISLAQAETLVRAEFFDVGSDLYTAFEFPLQELTSDEIWTRLGVQIFQVSGGVYQYHTYLARDGRIKALGTGFGGFGLTDMCVADLDDDGNPELIYTYSWGSGIHRAHLAAYFAEGAASRTIEANVVYLHGDMLLEKVDDHTLFVKTAEYDPGQQSFVALFSLGQVTLERRQDRLQLALALASDLPPETASRLSQLPESRTFEFIGGGAHHPEGFGEWRVGLDAAGTFRAAHNLYGDVTDYGPFTLTESENAQMWALIEAAGIDSLESWQRFGEPDEITFTFTLQDGTETHLVQIWAGDIENDDVAALVAGIVALIHAYTGQEAII